MLRHSAALQRGYKCWDPTASFCAGFQLLTGLARALGYPAHPCVAPCLASTGSRASYSAARSTFFGAVLEVSHVSLLDLEMAQNAFLIASSFAAG